jgi:O-antigen/teichoic acid export membrane protein
VSWTWNFVINVLGRGGAVLVAFIFTPVFFRMMGLEGYSLIAVFITFLSLTFILDFAFGATITRELARLSVVPDKGDDARDLTRTLEHLYLWVGIVVALAGYLAAPWLTSRWLNPQQLSAESVRHSIELMAVAIGLQVPLGMYVGGMYGLDRQPILNLAQFVLSICRYGGAALAMWMFDATPEVFFLWQLLFSLMQTVCVRTLLWRYLPRGSRPARFSTQVLRGTFHFTSRVAGTAVASFTLNQVDKLVLSRMMPLPALGAYMIGNQLSNATRLLSTLVETVVMPRMVAHTTRGEELQLRQLYHESCQLVALMTLPMSAAVVFFAEPLITLWIGDAEVAAFAAMPAALLTLGSALNALVRVPGGLTLARGWAAFGMWESLISVVMFVPLLITLVHFHGAAGAASSWLLLNLGYVLIDMPIIHGRMLPGEGKNWFVWSALAPGVIAFGIFGALRLALPIQAPLAETLLVAAAWLLVSLACALAMPHTRALLTRILARLLRR